MRKPLASEIARRLPELKSHLFRAPAPRPDPLAELAARWASRHPGLKTRLERAVAIVRAGGIADAGGGDFHVPSPRGGYHVVETAGPRGLCSCEDFSYRHRREGPAFRCAHLLAVALLVTLSRPLPPPPPSVPGDARAHVESGDHARGVLANEAAITESARRWGSIDRAVAASDRRASKARVRRQRERDEAEVRAFEAANRAELAGPGGQRLPDRGSNRDLHTMDSPSGSA